METIGLYLLHGAIATLMTISGWGMVTAPTEKPEKRKKCRIICFASVALSIALLILLYCKF